MRNATLLLACLAAGCFGDDRGHLADDTDDPDARVRADARPGDPDAEVIDPPDAEPPACATGESSAQCCTNGDDDDGDSLVDCLDPDCDGLAGCELGLELTCNDGVDNDGDGDEDCADATCGWGCTALPDCAGTDELIVLASADLPIAIVDSMTVVSAVAVARAGTIVDAAVRVDLTHTWVSDLDIALVAPTGENVNLSSDNGSDGHDYHDTVFTDAAAAGIASGTAPFTGQFRPEQPFASLAGLAALGTWELSVADDTDSDTGQLLEAGIALCIEP